MALKKFIGTQYPLVKSPRGLLAQKNGVEQIKADLLQLLLTNPGERVMLPSYGTPLRKLFFEPNDQSLYVQAQQMIANAITLWEPRVVITNISVGPVSDKTVLNANDNGTEMPAIVYIKISFVDPQNISQVNDLALTLPIGD